jgi:obg-like ATPase 1
MFLLTAKPVVHLVNLSERDYIRQKNKYLPKVAAWIKEHCPGETILPISVALEERLSRFENEAEVAEECKKIGASSALPKVIVTMRKALSLGSFFTTGPDEVRQWTIRNGTKAPQAAGVIHGDFEKTFIQVIVYNYAMLKELGTEAEIKAQGKIMTLSCSRPVPPRARWLSLDVQRLFDVIRKVGAVKNRLGRIRYHLFLASPGEDELE